MSTPTAPYIPTGSTSGGSDPALKSKVDRLAITVNAATSINNPGLVSRDTNGKSAFTTLEAQSISGPLDSGGILNIQGSLINLNGLDSRNQIGFDLINGTVNFGSTGSDPLSIFAPDTDLIVGGNNNLYLNASNVFCSSVPTSATNVTNKSYVDQAVQNGMAGLSWKNPVRLMTVAALPAYTATGTVALRTYTAVSVGALSVDSTAVAVGDRILLDQTNVAVDSGIFTVVNAGSAGTRWVLQRALDANNDPGVEVVSGMGMFVTDGVLSGDKQYVLTTNDPITLGTTALNFALFSAAPQTMSGEVTGTTSANTVTNAAVIGKVLTGFASTTGTVAAADTLLSFANKTTGNLTAITTAVGTPTNLNTASQIVKRDASGNFAAGTITATLAGNASTVTTNANLTGEVTSVGNAATLTNAAVIGKVLTGFAATTGTISAADSILTALQKIYGNSTGPLTCTTLTASGAATLNGGLNVTSGKFCVSANGGFSAPTAQGSYISWNRTGSLGMTSFMNQQGGGTGGWEWLNYNNSNVLSPSTAVMSMDALSNITLPGANTIIGGTSITVPTSTTASNCIQFLQLASPNGGYTVEMSVCVSSTSFSESTLYRIPMQFDATVSTWKSLVPEKYNAVFGSFRIDMTATGGTATFRLVRINGTVPGTAMISFRATGSVAYTLQSAVTTDTVVPAVYNATALTLPTVGGTASPLTYYEEYTHTSTYLSSSGTTPAATHSFVRVGKQVTMTVSATTWTPSSAAGTLTLSTTFPTRFAPANNTNQLISVYNNAALQLGASIVFANGAINIYPNVTQVGNFTAGAIAGFVWYSMSWCVA